MDTSVSEMSETTTELGSSIIKALAYSEVFSYPLTMDEIIHGLEVNCQNIDELESELSNLIARGLVYQYGKYYSLSSDKSHEPYRIERNKRAKKYLPWARITSRFIGNFPFVRAVFISGSLSKNSMDKDSDIDYFVITEVNRLWLARTMLILFKKVFLFNSYKLFCINFLIDKESLEIEDKNVFVAHEIASLIPTYSNDLCQDFFDSNRWTTTYLPNAVLPDTSGTPKGRIRGLKWLLEKILSLNFANSLEKKCHQLSNTYWKRKFKNLDPSAYQNAVVSKENMSTHHPDNFKLIVMKRRSEILHEVSTKKNVQLN